MESNPVTTTPLPDPDTPMGHCANGGLRCYRLEAESTTGFVAWRADDSTTVISGAIQVQLAPSPCIHFWSCAGPRDATPAGRLVVFDGHANALTHLDVRRLSSLQYLDGSFNHLRQLPLDNLAELEALDVDHNNLARLEVRHLRQLRVLNCAANHLTALDLRGLKRLQLLDCTQNPLTALRLSGCRSLEQRRSGA